MNTLCVTLAPDFCDRTADAVGVGNGDGEGGAARRREQGQGLGQQDSLQATPLTASARSGAACCLHTVCAQKSVPSSYLGQMEEALAEVGVVDLSRCQQRAESAVGWGRMPPRR